MSSPSSTRRRFPVCHPVVVADVGCACRRPKLPSLLSSSSMTKHRNTQTPSSPLSPSATTTTTSNTSLSDTTTSSCTEADSPEESSRKEEATTLSSTAGKKKKKAVKSTKVVEESEAVVKESSDPYVDFRESMLEMVAEKEIYAWEDLRDLLNRFLDLNSPYHHHLILRAFAEIMGLLFSPPARPGVVGEEGGAHVREARREGR